MPLAARIGDAHTCPMSDPKPHIGGTVMTGSYNVIIENRPAARQSDMLVCAGPNMITLGSGSVLISDRFAARVGDQTTHGGTIVLGLPTVLIGG